MWRVSGPNLPVTLYERTQIPGYYYGGSRIASEGKGREYTVPQSVPAENLEQIEALCHSSAGQIRGLQVQSLK